MHFKQSVSITTLVVASGLLTSLAEAQVANTTPSSANVLNLLAPYLDLNATTVGRNTLAINLQQAIATNNAAGLSQQALAISDKNLLGNAVNTVSTPNGNQIFGVAANLAGGLPAQTAVNGITPIQPVGGLGAVLGPAYQAGVLNGQLSLTSAMLVNAYAFTGSNLNAAKFYFANGTTDGTTTAVAPPGYTLPTANGLPNRTDSVYDVAYGVKNTDPGQNIYGSSRPVQVRPDSFNKFDPTALSGLTTNPSFPSGHTTYAFTDSILIGMLVPQQYQNMLLRASDYANSRIVLGVHYPLDIIGSRALVAYDLAQAFTNPLYINNAATTGVPVNLPGTFAATAAQMQTYLAAQCGSAVATCATSAANYANNPYVPSAANQALYISRLTYGMPTLTFRQAPREAAPAGGPDASILLAPLYGGSANAARVIAPNGGILGSLQTSTINQIILNTENEALTAFYGTPLSYWTRIDLYSAAGYFSNVTGTLSLAASDRVTTNVTIGAKGVLSADGTVSGSTTVGATGRLAGSGSVADVAVQQGGTLAPGSLAAQAALRDGQRNVAGTRLAVNGALTLSPGATFAIFATPRQATSVAATGLAVVTGANVAVRAIGQSFRLGQRFTILTANGGVGGQFARATTSLPFLAARLAYSPDSVTLSFRANGAAFSAAAATANQSNVAAALASASTNPANRGNALLNAAINLQSPAAARAAFDALSGEGLTAAQNAAYRSSQLFTSALFDQTTFYGTGGAANSVTLSERLPGFTALAPTQGQPIRELADLPAASPRAATPFAANRTWRAWGAGFGGIEDIDGGVRTGSAAQNSTMYGGAIGVDYQLLPNYLVGVAVGGSDADFRVGARATTGSTTGGHIALYDLATFGAFYGASSTSFSYFNNRTTRFVSGIAGLASETQRGTFDSHAFRTRLEVGRHFDGFGGSLTPFLALEIADLRSNGFAETTVTGPGRLGLNVSGQSTASVPGFIGARLQRITPLGNGMIFSPTLQVAYVHEFAPYRSQIAQLADLPGATFLVDGARPARNAAQVKAGGELIIGPRSALFANFDGEVSGINRLYAGKGGFRYLW